MSALRPGTASRLKTAQLSGDMTADNRGITALRFGTRGGVGAGPLHAALRVEDRPITQQGLTGLKTATRGPRRQIEDKSYFLGVLRGKINELNSEINIISKKITEAEEENSNFVQYEQMAESLAAELKALQGDLGDYNTLVDKATLGEDVSSVQLDWEEVRVCNERAERNLELVYEEKQNKEAILKSAEAELKQERQMAESVVQEMSDEQKEKYLRLKDLNTHFMEQLSNGHKQLEELNVRRSEMEDDMSTSQVKQEAIRLYRQLREAEARRDQLQKEAASSEDPQQERERLLKQVREDNQEIASMERQIREIQEKVTHREDELRLVEQDLDDSRSERVQKYRELKKREQQIDEFCKAFEETKALELSNMADLEQQIVQSLELASRQLINAGQTPGLGGAASAANAVVAMDTATGQGNINVANMRDQLQFKTAEVSKSESTATSLRAEQTRLQQDLAKVDLLESKITQEMETLKKRIADMEIDIEKFTDLDRVRDDAKLKRELLTEEHERLTRRRDNLARLNKSLASECTAGQRALVKQETNVQLSGLERRWQQLEQVNASLRDFIAVKRIETDQDGSLAKKARLLADQVNEDLKAALANKAMV